MPLPPGIDQTISQALDTLIRDAEDLLDTMSANNKVIFKGFYGGESERTTDSPRIGKREFSRLRTRCLALLQLLSHNNDYVGNLIQEVRSLEHKISHTEELIGMIQGLREIYHSGLLDNLANMIEAEVATDYMSQAEQLLGEGISGKYDYVPAAVLAGAVLEDALRRLCQRQNPPIDTLKPNGDNKTLDPLITDLQRANVFNKAKADQLRSWAKIRNYAAHGEFSEFNRAEVEAMITGIKGFIAGYL